VPRLVIFGALLNIVEDIVDRFFRVVSCDSIFDIGEKFGVVFSGLRRRSAEAH